MKAPDTPADEIQRLAALYQYHILDTEEEREFDELVQLASQICKTPISLITLVEEDRQWFKAKVGLEVNETSREVAFCAHAIHEDDLLIVRNAHEDERFFDNPLVTSYPNIRFYAGMPLINPSGYRLGTLCVIDTVARDLTDEQKFALKVLSEQVVKQMEIKLHNRQLVQALEKIEHQNTQLSKLNNINSKLLSIISHDLRNPITTMMGFLSLIESDSLSPDEVKKSTKGLANLLISSSDLLENLIQWGVSQMKGEVLYLQDLRLDLLVKEMAMSYDANFKTKENTIISHINKPYEIRADSVMLRFILRNLIQNANKFTSGGLIEIYAEQRDQVHVIQIKDNGSGIQKDKLDKLFVWENRVSTIGTAGEKGSGLGLLLCKEFVESHQGIIRVISEPRLGSTFTFTISRNL